LTPSWAVDCADYGAYPKWVASVSTPGDAYALKLADSYACLAENMGMGSEFHVADIADPLNPVIVGSVALPSGAEGLAVAGSCAYIADTSGGLQIVDITLPASPSIIGSWNDSPYQALDVEVSGDYAYVAYGFGGFKVFDVATPASPTLVDSLETNGQARAVALQGDYAYLGVFGDLRVIDITDPLDPLLVGNLQSPWGIVTDLVVEGNRAYLAVMGGGQQTGLKIVDISDPTNPFLMGAGGTMGNGVAVAGNYAYLSTHNIRGIEVFDIGDPWHLAFVTSIFTETYPRNLVAAGDYLFLANESDGMGVADISGVENVTLTGSANTGQSEYVAVAGEYAYVANSEGMMKVVDIADPTAPVVVGSLEVPGEVTDLSAGGSVVCLAAGGLRVVDVSTPSNPRLVGDVPMVAQGVAVAGNYAYVAAQWEIWIVDISDPSSPVPVGHTFPWWLAVDVALAGDLAYFVEQEIEPPFEAGRLSVYDVSDPTSPVRLADADAPGFPFSVATTGDRTCVAAAGGIHVYDTSGSPLFLTSFPAQLHAWSVAMVGDYAYLGGDKAGLEVVDISNPEEPELVGSVGTPSEVHGVAQSGDIVLAADYRYGLRILPMQCPGQSTVTATQVPAAIAHLSAYPNPVAAGTVIEWRGAPTGADLRLYDLHGRLVATRVVQGSGRVQWAEFVDHVRASGVYYLGLRTPGGNHQVTRLVVVR
jgi:hypothetical protein